MFDSSTCLPRLEPVTFIDDHGPNRASNPFLRQLVGHDALVRPQNLTSGLFIAGIVIFLKKPIIGMNWKFYKDQPY